MIVKEQLILYFVCYRDTGWVIPSTIPCPVVPRTNPWLAVEQTRLLQRSRLRIVVILSNDSWRLKSLDFCMCLLSSHAMTYIGNKSASRSGTNKVLLLLTYQHNRSIIVVIPSNDPWRLKTINFLPRHAMCYTENKSVFRSETNRAGIINTSIYTFG